jgi:hypothetical protein
VASMHAWLSLKGAHRSTFKVESCGRGALTHNLLALCVLTSARHELLVARLTGIGPENSHLRSKEIVGSSRGSRNRPMIV